MQGKDDEGDTAVERGGTHRTAHNLAQRGLDHAQYRHEADARHVVDKGGDEKNRGGVQGVAEKGGLAGTGADVSEDAPDERRKADSAGSQQIEGKPKREA